MNTDSSSSLADVQTISFALERAALPLKLTPEIRIVMEVSWTVSSVSP